MNSEGRPQGRGFSRRAVLLAGLAGAGAGGLAAAGGFALFGRGDGGGRATPGTPSPDTTGTPAAGPTPHPGLAAISRDDGAWTRTRLPDRGVILYNSGIGFIDTTTGEIDVMQLAATPDDFALGHGYRASPSGRFVSGEDLSPQGGRPYAGLLDRESGRAWSWDPTVLHLLYPGDEIFVFAAVRRDASYSNNPHLAGPVYVTDTDFQPLLEEDIGPDTSWQFQLAGPAAEADLFLLLRSSNPRPYILDFATGNVVEGQAIPSTDRPYALAPQSPPGVVSLLVDRIPAANAPPQPVRLDYDAGGRIVREAGINERFVDLVRSAPYSPDGRWLVRQSALRDTSFDLGDNEVWSFVELQDAETGRAAFRVLSGLLASGRPWLADSSAFIVESGRAGIEFSNYNDFRQNRGYYRVEPDKGGLISFDAVPDDLSFSPFFTGVVPAPDNPDLVAFGGTIVHNWRTGDWFGPGNGISTFGNPWDGDQSRELRFVFPPGGRDGAGSGTILPPYIEEPPFRNEVTLQIARAGTCVNLRSGPSNDAEVLDCLADGARLTVVEPSGSLPDEGDFGQFYNGRPAFWSADTFDSHDSPEAEKFQMFVHVRTQAGATGWVAIQYLDWAV